VGDLIFVLTNCVSSCKCAGFLPAARVLNTKDEEMAYEPVNALDNLEAVKIRFLSSYTVNAAVSVEDTVLSVYLTNE
jgi:hypothetical protein